jgi:hypothetical protein
MTPTKQTLVIALAVIVVVTMTASVASSYRSDADHSRASSDPQRENDRGRLANGDNPRDCQTGAALAPPFRGLITFHEGGTLSEFGVGPGSTPALRSPGHGVWRHEHGWRDYSFGFTHYRYDVSGALIGSNDITSALELGPSGDEYATSSAVQVFDASGNLIATACVTTAGTRFE